MRITPLRFAASTDVNNFGHYSPCVYKVVFTAIF